MITRMAIASDIDGILNLQVLNLHSHLSQEERDAGFVTIPFTAEQIEVLLTQKGAFVTEVEGRISGYIFAAPWDFFSPWAIFSVMVSRFPLKFQGTQITVSNTFQYGPVCIDRALRGKGVFPQLFATMRANFVDRYPIGVTFINKINARSLAAHTRKLGLEIIDDFEFNNNSYYSLAFPTKISKGVSSE